MVDLRARRQFQGATRSAVKCMIGYNHHAERHKNHNMKLPSDACPRCGKEEDWNHIVQCETLYSTNKKITNLIHQIKKKASNDQQTKVIESIQHDLETFLLHKTNNYQTKQVCLG